MEKIFENDYIVTDNGEVYRLPHSKRKEARKQNLRKHSNGYLRATIHGKDMYVHRLVAICFIPNPNEYKEVNHIDGDKTNNSVSNLEWCDRKQNNLHAFHVLKVRTAEDMKRISNSEKAVKVRKKRRRFSDDEVKTIRRLSKQGYSDSELSRLYKCARGVIYQIKKRISYKEVLE
jgi:hypothetical protein